MLGPLKMELQVVVDHLIDTGAGNETQVPEKGVVSLVSIFQPGSPERGWISP